MAKSLKRLCRHKNKQILAFEVSHGNYFLIVIVGTYSSKSKDLNIMDIE